MTNGTETKRLFKTNKRSRLARMLLDFAEIEVGFQKAYYKREYVKERTIMAYFKDLKKEYPKEKVSAMLTELVNAKLLDATNT